MKAFYGSRISGHMIRTPEGYLVCKDVPIARTGTQQYRGAEFGGPDAERAYTVKRPEDEVFTKAALASFEGKPVVDEHPGEDVTPANVGRYLKGTVRDVRRGDGEYSGCVMADLIIYDAELIRKIEDGKRDISCGYDCLWDPEDEGTYVQREIRGNHVAVVDRGRAGHKVSIRDADPGKEKRNMSKKNVWQRMFAAFAKDADTTPEDLDAAAKMRPSDDEDVPAPVEKPAPAIDAEELGARLDRVEDALDRITDTLSRFDAPKPEAKAEPQEEQDALDALEGELEGRPGVDDEDDVDVPPQEINKAHGEAEDEDDVIAPEGDPEGRAARDAALECVKALKPVIAALPRAQRKAAADSMAALIRGNLPDKGYAALAKAQRNGHAKACDGIMNDEEYGRMIRDKYNPHYRKGEN